MKRSPRAASSLLHLFCPVYLPRSVAPKKHGDVNDPSTRIKPNKKRVSWLGRVDVYRGTTAIKTFNGIKCTDAGRSRKRSALLNNTQKLQVSVKRFDKPRPNLAGNETVFTRATGDRTKKDTRKPYHFEVWRRAILDNGILESGYSFRFLALLPTFCSFHLACAGTYNS